MKKRLIPGLLVAALSALNAPAALANETVNSAQWDSWCQANKKRCERAVMLCEEYPQVSCDQIRLAFIQRRNLDNILPKD